ncbi:hypothetical protein SUGI_0638110 [Cryptomeria japonica]|nr:hypothetical protein SUGI_0638110 [Cryptomeria japonica]
MASMPTISTQQENELENAFQELAPSSMPIEQLPYDVFINHFGSNARYTLLTTTLHNILSGKGLRVFLDSAEFDLGDPLPTEIKAAMGRASLHIAIFFQGYAESPWCLQKLSFMLKSGTQIVPVFYRFEPFDVPFAKEVYDDAFSSHRSERSYTSGKLQEWKDALNNISSIVGHIVNNYHDERRLIKSIAHRSLRVIKKVPLVVAKHPVGLDEVLEELETELRSADDHRAQIVGIWGSGGCGKTTLAKHFYNNKYTIMEKSSFLFDVRDASARDALHNMQEKLMEDLGVHGVSLDSIEQGKRILASNLRSVRVLIVLDDVDDVDQLDSLIPEKNNLGLGSLIVVTSRQLHVLESWGISSIYKIKALDRSHAKQLFCWHAFLQPSPLSNELEYLVEKFLVACDGLPLSLMVLGAQFYDEFDLYCWNSQFQKRVKILRRDIKGKDKVGHDAQLHEEVIDLYYWNRHLQRMFRILRNDVRGKLRVSYDALNEEEKEMFLDTACFFIGEDKSLAIAVWDGSGWNGLQGLEVLVNKCLVDLNENNCIIMHDYLRDLGREIANRRAPYRLVFPKQIIFTRPREKIRIRGMINATGNYCYSLKGKIIMKTSERIRRLRPGSLRLNLFVGSGDFLNQEVCKLSRDLIWLRWKDYNHTNLPPWLSLQNLRVLELNGALNLQELWTDDACAPLQLRELTITGTWSASFERFPKSISNLKHLKKIALLGYVGKEIGIKGLPEEFCDLQSLEHLELRHCILLSSLPTRFGDLKKLRHLDLCSCKALRTLPVSFQQLRNLKYLDLSGCLKLQQLPHQITDQVCLRELRIQDTSLEELPSNIGQLSKLEVLTIGSQLLKRLPDSLGDLSGLKSLSIINCFALECLPETLGHLKLLEHLCIEATGVRSLPKGFRLLANLQTLKISDCPLRELDFGLEILLLSKNEFLEEIETLPATVKHIEWPECERLKNLKGVHALQITQRSAISERPEELDNLAGF